MSETLGPLADEDDAFGRLLLDYLSGRAGDPVLERDDGHAGPALGPEWFFAEPERWPDAERAVFGHVRGRVLDVGAGAGRHSVEAQRRGSDVVAIDVSPGAVEVCRRRGVRDARLLALGALEDELGVFNTVLMMCGNFGLVGNAEVPGEPSTGWTRSPLRTAASSSTRSTRMSTPMKRILPIRRETARRVGSRAR